MHCRTYPNLASMFSSKAAAGAGRPFLWTKKQGKYCASTWDEISKQVNRIARGLQQLGLQKGECAAIISENRSEWIVSDFAIISAGAIAVPVNIAFSTDDICHILRDSGAKIAFVSNQKILERLKSCFSEFSNISDIVLTEPSNIDIGPHIKIHSWADILTAGETFPNNIPQKLTEIQEDDVAYLMYTSGTGGQPKGVMTTHANILANCYGRTYNWQGVNLTNAKSLCFLPLAHCFEHTNGLMYPISIGAEIYFAEGAETLAINLIEVNPTFFNSVPRFYEAMRKKILLEVNRGNIFHQKLFHRILEIGKKRYNKNTLTVAERLIDLLFRNMVRNNAKKKFGNNILAMISGGAALNHEVNLFFLALDICIMQGYGQTEASPIISSNPPDLNQIKIGTAGKPQMGLEVKIADDGEILVRGKSVMKGYWNDPETTALVIKNGWLHTGDIGYFDDEGYLYITDRKRDFIKNSAGNMISPARVENCLSLQPEIEQAMVFGDMHPYLVAILVPNTETRNTVNEAVLRANEQLLPFERVRRFIIANEPFTIENGLLTPTRKIKRRFVYEIYGDELKKLYDGKLQGLST